MRFEFVVWNFILLSMLPTAVLADRASSAKPADGPYFDGKSYTVSEVTASPDPKGWPVLHFATKVPEACSGHATGTTNDGKEITFYVLPIHGDITTPAGTNWGDTLTAYAYDFDPTEAGESLGAFLLGLKGKPLQLSFSCFHSPTVVNAPNVIIAATPKRIRKLVDRQIVSITLQTAIPNSMGMVTLVDDTGATLAFSLIGNILKSDQSTHFDLNFYWGDHGELALKNISVGEYLNERGMSVDAFIKMITGKSARVSLSFYKDPYPPESTPATP